MRKIPLVLLLLSLLIFGFQAPTVKGQIHECQSHQMYSPIDATKSIEQFDSTCREYFVDALPTTVVTAEYLEQHLSRPQPNFVPADAFTLHSNPDANAIIYLDFDGHTWEAGTWWIGAYGIAVGDTSDGYTLDNDASTFTEVERNAIYEIWSNVAEEFSMYNVDVTTERPTGARESVFLARGSHALILSEASVQQGCGCGGVAYLNVFAGGNTWNYPALNFSKFGTYYAPPADTAEIISHEVGHNLGLAHDGTTTAIEYYGGHAMWTPIMGAGRGRGIATWSYGGYPNADTRWDQIAGDDDFAQIDYYLDFFADDYGDSISNAAVLDASALDSLTSGVISTRSDVDVFQFPVTEATSGMWEIEVLPAAYAPNLDVELKLFDASGTLLATENPLVSIPANSYTNLREGLGALMQVELSPGLYYIRLDGVGQGSLSLGTGYDDYASRGSYSIRFGSPSSGVFINDVLPSSAGRGTAIRILGSNLDEVTGLRLGASRITQFTNISANEIVFGVPSGIASGTLTVETNSGDVVALENFTVVNQSVPPTVSGLSSATGVLGQIIQVSGTNVGAATSVTLAGQPIAFSVKGSNSLQFQVTEGMSSGSLSVITAGGSASPRGSFTVLIPLTITSFSPTTTSIGSSIVITGTNFTSDTTVTFFGGTRATRTRITPTQITTTVPRGALSGPITLTNSIGSTTSVQNLTIAVPAPTVTRFSPTSARVGETVTITGTNFVNVQSVKLGTQFTIFTVVSPTSIRFTVPAGARTSTISVLTLSGSATSRSQLRIR